MTIEDEGAAPEVVTDVVDASNPVDAPAQAEELDETGDDAAAAAEAEPQQRPKQTAQERINELTRKAREAERDAEYWRSRATQPPQAQTQARPAEAAEDAEPDPSDYDHGDLDAGFIRDHARYHARQEFRQEQARAEAQSRTRTALSTFEQRTAEQFPDGEPEGITRLSRMPVLSQMIQEVILDSEVGPKLADYLGSNQRELSRISALPPLQQARELTKLEIKMSAPAVVKPKTISDAPGVTPQVRGQGGRFGVAPDTSDFAAFEKLADAAG